MTRDIGFLGTIYVSAVEPFPVDAAKDQINIDLKKDDIQKLIDHLSKVLQDTQESDAILISTRVRLEGEFLSDHFGSRPLKDVEGRAREMYDRALSRELEPRDGKKWIYCPNDGEPLVVNISNLIVTSIVCPRCGFSINQKDREFRDYQMRALPHQLQGIEEMQQIAEDLIDRLSEKFSPKES